MVNRGRLGRRRAALPSLCTNPGGVKAGTRAPRESLRSFPSQVNLAVALSCLLCVGTLRWYRFAFSSTRLEKRLLKSLCCSLRKAVKHRILGAGYTSALGGALVVNFALNLWAKGCFTSHILHLFQMIETNDISEEKIKMKQTMEGMKFYRFVLEHPVLVTPVPSFDFLLSQGRLCGRG